MGLLQRLLLLLKSRALRNVLAVLTVGLAVGLVVWGVDPDHSNQIVAAASLRDSSLRIDSVNCLSIDAHQVIVDQKDYWDPKLVEAIGHILSIKVVVFNADHATCPWGIFVVIVPKVIFAVRHAGSVARYLVSIGICERTVNGSMNPRKCLSKNIYVFNPRVETHELLSLALVGLAKRQGSDWEEFLEKRSQWPE